MTIKTRNEIKLLKAGAAAKDSTNAGNPNSVLGLDSVGGEPRDGSGFENEEPLADFSIEKE